MYVILCLHTHTHTHTQACMHAHAICMPCQLSYAVLLVRAIKPPAPYLPLISPPPPSHSQIYRPETTMQDWKSTIKWWPQAASAKLAPSFQVWKSSSSWLCSSTFESHAISWQILGSVQLIIISPPLYLWLCSLDIWRHCLRVTVIWKNTPG